MQSEQGERCASLPSLASLDEEFGGANQQVASEQEYQPRWRRRYVWFLLSSVVVLAAIPAVIWLNNAPQLWSSTQSAEQTTSRSSSGSPEPLIELGALKDEINELRYGQQKISAEITALRSAQQKLSSVKAMSWYSEPNALLHQQAASKPKAAAVRNSPSTQPRPAMQEANAEPRNGTPPLPLARFQTTAPDAVPVR